MPSYMNKPTANQMIENQGKGEITQEQVTAFMEEINAVQLKHGMKLVPHLNMNFVIQPMLANERDNFLPLDQQSKCGERADGIVVPNEGNA